MVRRETMTLGKSPHRQSFFQLKSETKVALEKAEQQIQIEDAA